ncbi:MAG: UDP-N-acetylmuramoyl-L-alanyl-D-glutamate--2,6-diaminopimelate ligase [Acidobacteriota bacterium]|nr:UDP-N-acetylmuramoyl-L-alanyl-D-glutamate--2,6-diaminopimelate ligase [Blastocatellia bacterium]MDW8412267.1 UDP-N-acetylmuramoyl-L-alanyl-D-glutamate--2,6-diaminopimelate ligase [Acidobacteriota bacterium]
MILGDLARVLDAETFGDMNVRITSVSHVASKCAPGDLFVAIKGFRFDGNDYVQQAVAAGAVAILSEFPRPEHLKLPWLRVANARQALARVAAEVYGHPSRFLQLIAVTGTNGKTTTVYLLDAVLRAAYSKSAMLSTVCTRVGEKVSASERTTPESTDIQRLLREAVDLGCPAAAMEASSHAIDLHRVDELHFSSVVFTNLTQDHLDYHKTMQAYYEVKRRLFDGTLDVRNAMAAINIDCPYGKRLIGETVCPVISYGINSGQVRALGYEMSIEGLWLAVEVMGEQVEIRSKLVGRPNVYNILAAIAATRSIGIDMGKIVKGVESLERVPGRFDRVPFDGDFAVFVDYAHTDDALSNVLATAREVAKGRVICLFGCGGDRDPLKRPKMGKAAALGSDLVILTSDNPRSEDPEKIMDQAEEGLRQVGRPYKRVADRREAIGLAISLARAGDVVVLAGKGHEDYQLIGDKKLHFDDREVAAEYLAAYQRT